MSELFKSTHAINLTQQKVVMINETASIGSALQVSHQLNDRV